MSATAAMATVISLTSTAPACDHCRQPLSRSTDDTGFGYSREPDTDLFSTDVPDGVELIFLTGRTPRRAA
jgi:hypothetical protein